MRLVGAVSINDAWFEGLRKSAIKCIMDLPFWFLLRQFHGMCSAVRSPNKHPEKMMNITNYLDSTEGWKTIIQELRNFRSNFLQDNKDYPNIFSPLNPDDEFLSGINIIKESYFGKKPVRVVVTARDGEYVLNKIFQIPVYVKQELIQRAASPSFFLINTLIMRSCTVKDFKEILKMCSLLNALAFLEKPEKSKIIIQPGEDYEKKFVLFGEDLRLECIANGIPPPSYQWYFGNVPLPSCISPVMILSDFREHKEGEYYCVVSQHLDDCIIEITSNIVVCSLIESAPEFVKNLQPKIQTTIGNEVKLEVEIFCRSKYTIEWIKENQILEGENNCSLILKNINISDAGEYRCAVKNSVEEVYSEECVLVVLPEKKMRRKASAKVALLIANSRYDNFENLETPIEDCILLAEKLENLDFEVITLINLTLQEMHYCINWFFENVPPKAYAFVCYIGHGFSVDNHKFMMPVDCPEKYQMGNCILDELIVKKSAESKLKLILVLDMCQIEPNRDLDIYKDKVPDCSYTPSSKFIKIQAYATSSHQGAYESSNMKHGLYITHICKHIESDKFVVNIFMLAHQEFMESQKIQQPTLTFAGDMIFKLTDPAKENYELLGPIRNLKENLKHEHELFFGKVKTCLFTTPHKGRILNAVDLKFTQTLWDEYTLSAEASPEALACNWTPSNKETEPFLTLYNLQKVKTNIYITLNLLDRDERLLASNDEDIDLGVPSIASIINLMKKKNLMENKNTEN